MKWQSLLAAAVICISCKKDAPPPATATPGAQQALTPAQLDTMRRDSIFAAASDSMEAAMARVDSQTFKTIADSMSLLETRLKSDSSPTDAAPTLLRLGELKERANSWMILNGSGRSTGAEYAKAHSDEYGYFDPDGRFYYNGRQWRDLLTRFPQSSLADSARWYLAHLQRGHGD